MKEWKILNLKYGSHSQVQTYFNSNVVSLLAETIPRPHFQFLYLRPNHIFFYIPIHNYRCCLLQHLYIETV